MKANSASNVGQKQPSKSDRLVEYISVIWKHEDSRTPVRLVSELDSERWELRKLEFFADGSVGVAGGGHEDPRTMLGTVAVPPLSDVNDDPQFEGVLISQSEFEALWVEHASAV